MKRLSIVLTTLISAPMIHAMQEHKQDESTKKLAPHKIAQLSIVVELCSPVSKKKTPPIDLKEWHTSDELSEHTRASSVSSSTIFSLPFDEPYCQLYSDDEDVSELIPLLNRSSLLGRSVPLDELFSHIETQKAHGSLSPHPKTQIEVKK
ncbi:MAG: hypothetical protein P4L31_02800 [Candidatus Babeliales bacterium]|nr:hypothetical protein [Candidatus Babeliales bacterium]